MPPQKKDYNIPFIIISLLALGAFFVVVSQFSYLFQNSSENKKTDNIDDQVIYLDTDPYITKATDFYASFARGEIRTRGQGSLPVLVFCSFGQTECAPVWGALENLDTEKFTAIWKDISLPENFLSRQAFGAAICAGEQGKFWQFGDQLFKLNKFSEEDFLSIANQLGLNLDEFGTCFNSGDYIQSISQDLADSEKLLIDLPPYVILGSKRITADQMSDLNSYIEQILSSEE